MPETEKVNTRPKKQKDAGQRRKEAVQKWMERRKKQGWKRKDVWVPPGHVVRVVPKNQKEENCVQAEENAPAQNRVDDPGLLRELFNDAAAKAAELQTKLNDVMAEKERLEKECEELRQRIFSGKPVAGEKDDGSSLALDALIRWREAVLRMGLIDRLLARWPLWPEIEQMRIPSSNEEYTENFDHA